MNLSFTICPHKKPHVSVDGTDYSKGRRMKDKCEKKNGQVATAIANVAGDVSAAVDTLSTAATVFGGKLPSVVDNIGASAAIIQNTIENPRQGVGIVEGIACAAVNLAVQTGVATKIYATAAVEGAALTPMPHPAAKALGAALGMAAAIPVINEVAPKCGEAAQAACHATFDAVKDIFVGPKPFIVQDVPEYIKHTSTTSPNPPPPKAPTPRGAAKNSEPSQSFFNTSFTPGPSLAQSVSSSLFSGASGLYPLSRQNQHCMQTFLTEQMRHMDLNSFFDSSISSMKSSLEGAAKSGLEPLGRDLNHRKIVDEAIRSTLLSFAKPTAQLAMMMANSVLGIGERISMSEFREVASQCDLINTFNSYHPDAALYDIVKFIKDIGGVAHDIAQIKDLIDSEAHEQADAYHFLMPSHPALSEKTMKKIASEVHHAWSKHKMLPFFSLHFNQKGALYPVIPPVFINTLTGQVIAFLDYWMKCYLNGGFFDLEFLKSWHHSENLSEDYLKKHLVDLKKYSQTHAKEITYLSLRELMARFGLEDATHSSEYKQPFQTSFRIISHQEKIQRHGNIIIPSPTFRVEYSIDIAPDYQAFIDHFFREHASYPEDYNRIQHCYHLFAKEIEEKLPKLPFCQDYFQLLGFINTLCYFYVTLDAMDKAPVLPAKEQTTSSDHVPKSLPPIPVRYYKKLSLTVSLREVALAIQTSFGKKVLDEKLLLLIAQKYRSISLPPDIKSMLAKVCRALLQEKVNAKVPLEKNCELNEEALDQLIRNSEANLLLYIHLKRREIKQYFEDYATNLEARFSLFPQTPSDLKKRLVGTPDPNKIALKKLIDTKDPVLKLQSLEALVLSSQHTINVACQTHKALAKKWFDKIKPILSPVFAEGLEQLSQEQINKVPPQHRVMEEQRLFQMYLQLIHSAEIKTIQLQRKNILHFSDFFERLTEGSIILNDYTHTLIGFTGEKLDEKTHLRTRISGGCGLSLETITTEAIENPQHLAQSVANILSAKQTDANVIDWEGKSYSIFSVSVTQKKLIELPAHLNTTMHALVEASVSQTLEPSQLPREVSTALLDDSGGTFIHYAATFLDVNSFKKLQRDPAFAGKTQQPDALGCLPIHYAAQAGNTSLVAYLSVCAMMRESKTKRGLTPLLIAVEQGQLAVVKTLCGLGADVNYRLPNGLSALQIAIQNHFESIALCLLAIPHLQFNMPLDTGETPLHAAIQYGLLSIAERLVLKSADLKVKRKSDGFTPFHLAAEKGAEPLVQSMLKLDPTLSNLALESKKTALHLAAAQGHAEVLKLLLIKGGQPNIKSDIDETPLVIAIQAGFLASAEILEPLTAINLKNKQSQTASQLALLQGMPSISDKLIARGEEIIQKDKFGDDYLSLLVRHGEIQRFWSLLKMRPEIKLTRLSYQNGQNLVTIAAISGQFSLVYQLQKAGLQFEKSTKNGCKLLLIHYAVMWDEVRFVQDWVLDNQDKVEKNGISFAYLAAEHASQKTLKWLLKRLTSKEIKEQQILLAAIESHDIDTFEQVLEKCNDLNETLDKNDNTALHRVVTLGSRAMLESLLAHGVQLGLRNKAGQTAFHIALKAEDAYLLKRLFKLSRPNDWPRDLWIFNSSSQCSPEIAKLLTKYGKKIAVLSSVTIPIEPPKSQPVFEVCLATQDAQKELMNYLDVGFFDVAYDLLIENPPLISVFRSRQGGKFLQAIFSNVLNEDHQLYISPHELLDYLKKQGVNPSQFSGSDNVLSVLLVQNEQCAIDRLALFSRYFPDSVGVLVRDSIHTSCSLLKSILLMGHANLFEKLDEFSQENNDDGIHEAVKSNYYPIVARLLKRYSPDHPNPKQETPLMLAALKGNIQMMGLLLSHGASLLKRSREGFTVLHYVIMSESTEALIWLLSSLPKKLLTISNRRGDTPLAFASGLGYLPMVRVLMTKGECLSETVNVRGLNALHLAAHKGHVKVVEYLVEQGFLIDAPQAPLTLSKIKKEMQLTPLYMAARSGKKEAVCRLIELGADRKVKDKQGYTLCEHAIISRDKAMHQLIQQLPEFHDRERTKLLLHAAARANNVVAVSQLILKGADINATNEQGRTAIHLAAIEHASDVLEHLLKGKVLLDLSDQLGQMPLHYAAFSGNVAVIHMLIRAGAPINALNKEGDSALCIASLEGHIGAVTALLNEGADYSLCDHTGLTPAQIALNQDHIELVSRFRSYSKDPSLELSAISCLPEALRASLIPKCNNFWDTMDKTSKTKGVGPYLVGFFGLTTVREDKPTLSCLSTAP